MNLTAKVKELDTAYFSRTLFQNPLFIIVTVLALLTLGRTMWILIGFWPMLSVHSRVMAACLLLVLPGPLVLALRLRQRISEKLLALGDDDLRGDIGRFFVIAPFFGYFGIYLAIEMLFLALRHS